MRKGNEKKSYMRDPHRDRGGRRSFHRHRVAHDQKEEDDFGRICSMRSIT